MHYTYDMKATEVEVNKRFTIMVNDREHKAFKMKCVEQGIDMSAVLREFMRDFVKGKKKK